MCGENDGDCGESLCSLCIIDWNGSGLGGTIQMKRPVSAGAMTCFSISACQSSTDGDAMSRLYGELRAQVASSLSATEDLRGYRLEATTEGHGD